MNIVHISRDRFEGIRSQVLLSPALLARLRDAAQGEGEYHLLDGESGHCEYCNAEFESVKVKTPAELETVLQMRA